MRKVLLFLAAVLCLGLCPVATYASNPYEGNEDACSITGNTDPLLCGTGKSNEERELQQKVKNILEVVYLWIGIITVIVIVIAGVRYMTSQGEPDKIKGAKTTLTYAIIGLIIVLLAFAITEFFIGALDGRAPDETSTTASSPGGEHDSSKPDGGSSGSEDVAVKSIQMASKTTITEGDSMQLKVRLIPDYATDHTVKFTSSKQSVATITENGKMTAVEPGTTTITAKANNGVTATMTVSVVEIVKVTSIDLRPTNFTLTKK